MISVTTANVLTAWEAGLHEQPSRRVLSLLVATYPMIPEEELAKLGIGQRDGLLLELRETLFGSQLTSVSLCPACSERLELMLNVADIKANPGIQPRSDLSLSLADFQINYRLPNSQDLMLIENTGDLAKAKDLLLERCLLSVECDGHKLKATELPEDILSQIETAMSDADPQADVQLNLSCPSCQHHWTAVFDIASFLWCEIDAWAKRILKEVHTLAKAYGWREHDILSLSQGGDSTIWH